MLTSLPDRTWAVKPPPGVGLNQSHPTIRGLRFYTAFQEATRMARGTATLQGAAFLDLIGHTVLRPRGNVGNFPSRFLSRTGGGVQFDASNSCALSPDADSPPLLQDLKRQLTCIMKYRADTAFGNNGRAQFGKMNQVGSNGAHFGFNPASNFGHRFQVGNGVTIGSAIATRTNYNDGKFYTVCGVWDGSTVRLIIFDDLGQLVENVTGSALAGTPNDAQLQGGMRVSGWNDVDTVNSAGAFEWVGVWDRPLALSTLEELATTPYCLFRGGRQWALPLPPPPPPGAIAPVIARRRQTWLPPTKPQLTGLALDRQHPLTQGMLVCIPFFEGRGSAVLDYARNVSVSPIGPMAWDQDGGALGARLTGAASNAWELGTDGTDLILPRRRITVLFARVRNDAVTNRVAFGSNANNVNGIFQCQLPNASSQALWRFGSSASQSVWSGMPSIQNVVDYWAFTAGATGTHIYYQGQRVASNAVVEEREETIGALIRLGAATGGSALADTHVFFALLDAEWSHGQVRSWVRDPWQFFKKGALGNATRIVPALPAAPYSQGVGAEQTVRAPQPVQNAGAINWRHPLARGLRMHVTLNAWMNARPTMVYDRVTNTPFQSFIPGTTDGTPSRTGKTMALNGSSSGKINTLALGVQNVPATLLNWRSTEPVTFAAKFAGGVNGAGTGEVVSLSRSLTCDMGIQVLSGPVIRFVVLDAAVSAVQTQARTEYGDNQTFHTVFARVAGAGIGAFIELYVFDENGILIESATGTGALASYPGLVGASSVVGFGTGGNGLGAFSVSEWWGIWKQYMSVGDMAQLAQNPYQIFQPPVQERFARRALISVPYNPPVRPYSIRPATKPEPGRQLDRKHPLVRNLRCYLPFNEVPRLGSAAGADGGKPFRDLISGRAFANSYNFGFGPIAGNPSRTGPTVHMTGDAAAQINSSETLVLDGTRGQVPTLLADYTVTPITLAVKFGFGNGSGNNHMFGIASASLDRAILQLVFGTHVVRFNTGSATVDSVNAYNTDRFYTVFGRMTAPVINSFPELFIYDEAGVLLEHIVSGVQQQWGLNNVAITFLGIFGAIADYEWAGIWHEVLSEASMAALAREPYQIFEPPATRKARKLLKFVVSTPGTISPTGIASEEALGTPNLVRLALYPTGIPTVEVHGTPHIGDVDPSGIASAEAFGTARLLAGDINPDGIASAENVSDGANLIGEAGAGDTLSPSSIASAQALGTPTLTEVATIHPTGIPSGFDMDLHHVGVDVATIAPFGIESEEAFADVSTTALGTPIGGTSVNGPPQNPPAPPAGTVTAKKLCSPFDLILAGLYSTAASPAAILPEVYGDFSVGGLRGPIPTVLVTQSSPWIFIAAMHPVQSIDQVYINDVQQVSGFAAIPQVALGGGPQVALIAFDEQPIGEVTWRGKGKMDANGALITDPILQLEDLLLTRGGYSTTDFDATTLAQAKSLSAAAGWSTAFVINDTSQMQAWITEILFNVMGYWRVTGRAQLQMMIDTGGSFAQADLVDSVVASRDAIDGDDGVTFIADRQQLVNQLVANYQYSWQEQQYTAQLIDDTVRDAKSANAYGEVRKEVTLRGHRDPVKVAAWAAILFDRQAFETRVEGGQVQFSVQGPRLIHATVGDLIAFTWPYGPTRESGHPYVNQILRIVQINQDFTRGGSTQVVAVDTGAYVTSAGARLLTPLAI